MNELAAMSADQMLSELEARSTALATALDPERRQQALAETLRPFQPGEQWAYVPRKEGIDPATKKFIEEEDQQAAFKLFHLEDFVIHAEPVARALEDREKEPLTAEAAALIRSNRVGVSMTDALLIQIADELRAQRLSGFAQGARATEQFAAWQEADADRTEARNNTVLRVLEAQHRHGFSGPKPESPEDLKAAQLLRKAIVASRDERVSESTRKLQARIAAAKNQIGKVKTLHQIAPANPEHPGAVQER